MKRSLILHIGHPKTGATTLQKLVFPQLTGTTYFDRDQTPASAGFVGSFVSSPGIWRRQGDGIFALLDAEMRGKQAQGSALISAASMSTHRIFAPWSADNHWRDPFLLAVHLRECLATAKRAGFDDMRIILGIQRQDQALASRYATYGWQAARPGQEDFERQTLEIIDPERRYFLDGLWLDYKTTYDLVVGVVGELNLLLLPLEQLEERPSEYLATLSAFLGEPLDPNALGSGREKVRGVGQDVWRLKGKLMRRAARRRRLGMLQALLTDEAEIRLSEDLRSKILTVYRDSNRQLASSLALDLAQYGYCDA